MIKKLRRKFIWINMLCIMSILLAVFSGLFWFSYQRYVVEGKMTMSQALEGFYPWIPEYVFFGEQGRGQQAINQRDNRTQENGKNREDKETNETKENREAADGSMRKARMEMRDARPPLLMMPMFVVTLDQNDEILDIQVWNMTLEEGLAESAAALANQDGAFEGTLNAYGLTYLRREGRGDDQGETRIVFADRYYAFQFAKGQLVSYLLWFLAAAGAFFLLSVYLSKWALRPVERAWEQQNQFIADASHELKTPLTVILANLNILSSHRKETIDSQFKWVENTKSEAASMKKLVEDLLFLARSEAGRLPVAEEEVDLGDVVLNSVLPFEPLAFERGITLDTQVEPGIQVWGDRSQLKQLAVILTDNACKYASKNGTVRITVCQSGGGRPCLKVENSGSLIPQEDLEHIFERFYRADKARVRREGGYGLGLSIAKTIVERHRGRIQAESRADADDKKDTKNTKNKENTGNTENMVKAANTTPIVEGVTIFTVTFPPIGKGGKGENR